MSDEVNGRQPAQVPMPSPDDECAEEDTAAMSAEQSESHSPVCSQTSGSETGASHPQKIIRHDWCREQCALRENHLLTVEEAACVLSMGRSFLYVLLKRGEIRSLKIAGARRIPFSAIEEFTAEHLHRASSSEEAPR